MNLILLFEKDFLDPGRVLLSGRRLEHVQSVLKSKLGDELSVGVINGKMGKGKIVKLTPESVELTVNLSEDPPEALPVTLICALPRPGVVKRLLLSCASMGIKKIIFLNFNRVEKSLWQSVTLKPNAIEDELLLGLEQAKDTRLPEVILRPRFKPFVEDELPILIEGTKPLLAHPGALQSCPRNLKTPVTLIIGPEGGFVPFELDKLQSLGFEMFHLGPRILRTETVVPYILGRLFG